MSAIGNELASLKNLALPNMDEIYEEKDPNTAEDARRNAQSNAWDETGSQYHVSPVANQIPILPTAVYVLKVHPNGVLFLERLENKFSFPFKIYGLETEFIKRVMKTYAATKSNLGILMNGVKGTGKTVTAEIIANHLNQPCILINGNFSGLVNFINDIQQPVTLFFDEFEKAFPNDYRTEGQLLTIMDGAMKNKFRKVFLLTTNKLSVEENLLQRPGRIRYLKAFGNLPLATIIEIVDDKLIHKARRKDVITFIARLELITVDIVSAVIEEVNIHDEDTEKYPDFFNVKQLSNKVDVYMIVDTNDPEKPVKETLVKSNYILEQMLPYNNDDHLGEYLTFTNEHFGEVVEIKGDGNVVVLKRNNPKRVKMVKEGKKLVAKADPKAPATISRTYKLNKAYSYNSTFASYRYIDI